MATHELRQAAGCPRCWDGPSGRQVGLGRILSVTPGEQLTGRIMGAAMSYVLVSDGGTTRLLLKIVTPGGRWTAPLLSVGDLVMARRQLFNLKRLAEWPVSAPGTEPPWWLI